LRKRVRQSRNTIEQFLSADEWGGLAFGLENGRNCRLAPEP
jgi:hypothetical protein